MKLNIPLTLLAICTLSSCDFNISYNKDLISGITSRGNGISCTDVFLTVGEQKINTTSFVYGEKFFLNLNDIKGFEKVDGNVFPGMELLVSTQNGDTVLFTKDAYENQYNGISYSPLLLTAHIITATPLQSGENYTFKSKVWDKKGEGTFTIEFDFDVESNEKIEILQNDFTYNEIYLFSAERNLAVTDGKILSNESIYLLFEGLEGFEESNGKAALGIGIKVTDNKGNLILEEKDLMSDDEVEVDKISQQVSAKIPIPKSAFSQVISFETTVWDKNGSKRITVTTELNLNGQD